MIRSANPRTGVGLAIADVVTVRQQDLHRELLDLVEMDHPSSEDADPLYAVSYRAVGVEEARLDVWPHRLRVGGVLPTLPLWLTPDFAAPVDLAASYAAACEALGIV